MPSFPTAKLPMSKSWEEFEEIVADIAVLLWNDKYIVRNGRKGQAQNGVDIYGSPVQGEYAGIQCKNKPITIQEVKKEIAEAEKFKPLLNKFVFTVGAPTDSKLQEEIRKIDHQRRKDEKFSVSVLFWEDICLRLADKPELMEKHFPDFIQRQSSVTTIHKKIRNSTPDDWLYDDHQGIYTYRKDTHLTIRRVEEEKEPFNKPWLKNFADEKGYRGLFDIYYGSSFIERFYTVAVDGYRCFIPYPRLKDMTITEYQYDICKIINGCLAKIAFHEFDEYLKKADIKIVL